MALKPTAKEKKAIDGLKKLAETWPKSLWLFSASGTLTVMRRNNEGRMAFTEMGGVDREFIVDTVDIPNDGGDW